MESSSLNSYLVLIDCLIGDLPETGSQVDRYYYLPFHRVAQADVAPSYQDSNFGHNTLRKKERSAQVRTRMRFNDVPRESEQSLSIAIGSFRYLKPGYIGHTHFTGRVDDRKRNCKCANP
jgi:hypothetical protein